MSFRPTWVAFTPWTTARDYLDMLDWIDARGLADQVDPVQLTLRLLVPPGSLLLGRPGFRRHERGLDPAAFLHRWEHPDPRLDGLQRELASVVEADHAAEEDPLRTFHRVREAAGRALDVPVPPVPEIPPPNVRRRPPRLTESWFC